MLTPYYITVPMVCILILLVLVPIPSLEAPPTQLLLLSLLPLRPLLSSRTMVTHLGPFPCLLFLSLLLLPLHGRDRGRARRHHALYALQ